MLNNIIKKSAYSIMITLTLSLIMPFNAKASSEIYVIIDHQQQHFDQAPVIVHDRTLVPLRGIFEKLGADVTWDQDTQTVTGAKGNTTIKLQIGSKAAVKNGANISLDVEPQLINDRTMVPIRFISESLGYSVDWNGTNQVSISTVSDHDMTAKEIGKLSDHVVLIELYDDFNEKIASGSGVIVYSDAPMILTNYHVIQGASKAKITYADGSSSTSTIVVNADPKNDLALLLVDRVDIPCVNFGDSSKVSLGDQVVALGSPLGFQNTLSTGVISTVSRQIGDQAYIQTSAPIDHGSSGGALFNMRGELIGITSAGFASQAELNLAIPSNTVKHFMDSLQTPQNINNYKVKYEIDTLQNYLNQNFSTVTFNKNSYHFKYYVVYADQNKTSYKIVMLLQSLDEYLKMVDEYNKSSDVIAPMVINMLKIAHDKGATMPNVVMYTDFNVPYVSNIYPSSEFSKNPGGTFYWQHVIGESSFDDNTRNASYIVEPDFNKDIQKRTL